MCVTGLGLALGQNGDTAGEIAEYRAALRLNPKNGDTHVSLGDALAAKGASWTVLLRNTERLCA